MVEIEIVESRALSKRAATAIALGFAAFAMVSVLRFPAPALWPIFTAMAIYTLLFIGLSLIFVMRPRRVERIRIQGPVLTIEAVCGRSVSRWDWRTPWTWLDVHDDGEDQVALWLVSGDVRIAIATHVGVRARRHIASCLGPHIRHRGSSALRLA